MAKDPEEETLEITEYKNPSASPRKKILGKLSRRGGLSTLNIFKNALIMSMQQWFSKEWMGKLLSFSPQKEVLAWQTRVLLWVLVKHWVKSPMVSDEVWVGM